MKSGASIDSSLLSLLQHTSNNELGFKIMDPLLQMGNGAAAGKILLKLVETDRVIEIEEFGLKFLQKITPKASLEVKTVARELLQNPKFIGRLQNSPSFLKILRGFFEVSLSTIEDKQAFSSEMIKVASSHFSLADFIEMENWLPHLKNYQDLLKRSKIASTELSSYFEVLFGSLKKSTSPHSLYTLFKLFIEEEISFSVTPEIEKSFIEMIVHAKSFVGKDKKNLDDLVGFIERSSNLIASFYRRCANNSLSGDHRFLSDI